MINQRFYNQIYSVYNLICTLTSRRRQNHIEAHIIIHNGAEFMLMMMTTAGKQGEIIGREPLLLSHQEDFSVRTAQTGHCVQRQLSEQQTICLTRTSLSSHKL